MKKGVPKKYILGFWGGFEGNHPTLAPKTKIEIHATGV